MHHHICIVVQIKCQIKYIFHLIKFNNVWFTQLQSLSRESAWDVRTSSIPRQDVKIQLTISVLSVFIICIDAYLTTAINPIDYCCAHFRQRYRLIMQIRKRRSMSSQLCSIDERLCQYIDILLCWKVHYNTYNMLSGLVLLK